MTAADVVAAVTDRVVGRRREIEVVAAALAAGRHVLLEGPPGTGKSTVLRAVADALGTGFEFVEGNAELTPARLIGSFDPARVLHDGYAPDTFVDGPLASALRDGSLLYIEEINRIPEETLNVLVTVMSEGELHVPRLGHIVANDGFRLVAAMNPFDAVGTARISSAIYDRTCRVAMDYQDAHAEASIVVRQADADAADPDLPKLVGLVRATRSHPDLRIGSSVRGAIDLAMVWRELCGLRDATPGHRGAGLDAAMAALTGRIRLHEGVARTPEEVVTELWLAAFPMESDDGEGGGGEGEGKAPTSGIHPGATAAN